jgi:very-short-patch-repair endonuclease
VAHPLPGGAADFTNKEKTKGVGNRKIIPYNPKLKELAKKLRQTMTFSEVKLWNEIKNGQLMGYDFDRQRPIGNYIVDFYCKDLMLALEIDGITHHDEKVILKDKFRQEELEMAGVSFLRFDALLCINKVEAVVKEIARWILDYEEKYGVNENVKRKREALENPKSRKR